MKMPQVAVLELALVLVASCASVKETNPSPGGTGGSVRGTGAVGGTGGDVRGTAGTSGGSTTGCQGLQCQRVECPNAGKTTLRGKVYDPAGKVPLYNVILYVPSFPDQVAPIVQGASCVRCDSPVSGRPAASALTDPTGQFVMENLPVGTNIPLVIQIGKWRRVVNIPEVKPCVDNVLADPQLLRLPRNQREGSIPKIAITTGDADRLHCLLTRMGVDKSEFTNPDGLGAINLYYDNGVSSYGPDAAMPGATFPQAVPFWENQGTLMKYDVVMLACGGDDNRYDPPTGYVTETARQAMKAYVDKGGRVFAEHYHQSWIKAWTDVDDGQPITPALFGEVATWQPTAPAAASRVSSIETSFPKGAAFADWLWGVGASPMRGQILLDSNVKNTAGDTIAGVSLRWIYDPGPSLSGPATAVHYMTFNAPVGQPPAQQCGRFVFTGVHVASVGLTADPKTPFPSSCVDRDLGNQEKALEFMLFDLSACLLDDSIVPVPPIF